MKLILAVVCLSLMACAYGLTVEQEWKNFKVKRNSGNTTSRVTLHSSVSQDLFGRNFNNEEDTWRFKIFKTNVELVEQQNAKFARGESDHGAAINDFSDRTPQEKQVLEGIVRPVPAVA